MSQLQLTGKVVMVTGSTSGIGLGIAHALASHGCHVIMTGPQPETEIQAQLEEFRTKYDAQMNYLSADLAKPDDITRLWIDVKKLCPNGVDILINNAGLQVLSPVEDYPLDTWSHLLAVMLTAPFLLVKHALPDMRMKGWGRIVNVSSVAGVVARKNMVAYVSAKHGLNGMTKAVALETAGSGVTCNAVSPGYVNTEGLRNKISTLIPEFGSYEAAEKFLMKSQPTGAMIEVEQVAGLVSYICSPGAAHMTGSIVTMDGAYTAQ